MRSLGPRSVRVPTVAGLSRMGMKIYTVGARRMPRYFRVVYHQKWPRTHLFCQSTLAHFFLWHLQIRWGKKSPSADGITGADPAGSGLAHAHVHSGGCPRAGGVGPAVQSPGVSVAPKA